MPSLPLSQYFYIPWTKVFFKMCTSISIISLTSSKYTIISLLGHNFDKFSNFEKQLTEKKNHHLLHIRNLRNRVFHPISIHYVKNALWEPIGCHLTRKPSWTKLWPKLGPGFANVKLPFCYLVIFPLLSLNAIFNIFGFSFSIRYCIGLVSNQFH